MKPKHFYRIVLAGMSSLLLIGIIEFQTWSLLIVFAGFGLVVWRSEFPTWDELWEKKDEHSL